MQTDSNHRVAPPGTWRANRSSRIGGSHLVWLVVVLICCVSALMLSAPVSAQWPTTQWQVREFDKKEPKQPEGERRKIAEHHEKLLQQASRWFESMDFPEPRQITIDGGIPHDLAREVRNTSGADYLAFLKADDTEMSSTHSSPDEFMRLSTYPGYFKLPMEPWYDLMQYSSVHELFHAVQKWYTGFRMWSGSKPAGPQDCAAGARADQWITEGTAAYVQVRWYERPHRQLRYGHQFKGSPRAGWVRYFDQRLDWGSLPFPKPGRQTKSDDGLAVSWYCSYGSWYFWYAVGEMLAGTNDDARIGYLRYIFKQPGPWKETGVAMVDAGLKEAAAHYNSLEGYSHGLYDLYPEFVAQYLDVAAFYEHVRDVQLGSPGLFDTVVQGESELLHPLSTHAWRLRLQLPPSLSQRSVLRVTLDAAGGSDRDNLHLIVDRMVVPRPTQPDTPYTLEALAPKRGGDPTPIEFLVRVANVGEDAVATAPAAYRLKIEVEGYYGDQLVDNTQPFDPQADAAAIAAALPPGFDIQGPETWRCSGGARSRALFSIDTPDRVADSIERVATEGLDMVTNLDPIMKSLQRMQQLDLDTGVDLDALQAQMEQTQQRTREMKKQLAPEIKARANAAAAEARSHDRTSLRATFASGGDCQLLVHAEWPRHTEGSIVAGTDFNISVYSEARTENLIDLAADLAKIASDDLMQLQAMAETMKQPQCTWKTCRGDGTDAQECNPGQLNLESASSERLVGTFGFDVVHTHREPNKSCPGGAQTVSGYFSATSTVEDARSVMDALLPGRTGPNIPGAPMLDLAGFD